MWLFCKQYAFRGGHMGGGLLTYSNGFEFLVNRGEVLAELS